MIRSSSAELESRVRRNLTAVRERIAAACARAGRDPDSVRLIAVTKYAPPGAIAALLACGQREFGENRVQQLEQRVAEFGAAAELLDERAPADERRPCWHMIGHLQRNKVRKLLPHVRIVHSLDSVRLAQELELRAAACACTLDALIEVNVSGEQSKTGTPESELPALIAELNQCPHVRLRGLMTMAPLEAEPDTSRPYFARLRVLLGELRERGVVTPDCDQLSMGMSNDYPVAIEEGASIVRIGSALYEGLATS